MRLQNKVAIVTGAATGVGESISLLFAQEGAKVVIADVDMEGAERTAARIRSEGREALAVRTDISQEADAKRLVAEAHQAFGQVNILVNNAAIFVLKGFDATVEEFQRSMNVNVIGTALVTKYAAESMKQAGGGAVVNLASVSAWVAQRDFFVYSASKAAILQMTRNMAMDLAPFGIRVNCICPGTVVTAAVHRYMEDRGLTMDEMNAEQGGKTLLGRLGRPEEVAHAALFLASEEASYITGTHLMVDGGYTAI